jgi:hypothetical protein
MTVQAGDSKYVPGTYPGRRRSASELASRYVREWDEKRLENGRREPDRVEFSPTICISRKLAVAIFDERYPGKLSELVTLAFGEKAFIKSDYTKQLFSSVYAIAAFGPTIFVGRGVHLLLPREKVLAVRIISSVQFRVKRLALLMKVPEAEAAKQLKDLDRQQAAFFKEVYNKKDASPYEFDLVVNCDHINEPRSVAEIILAAFREKF